MTFGAFSIGAFDFVDARSLEDAAAVDAIQLGNRRLVDLLAYGQRGGELCSVRENREQDRVDAEHRKDYLAGKREKTTPDPPRTDDAVCNHNEGIFHFVVSTAGELLGTYGLYNAREAGQSGRLEAMPMPALPVGVVELEVRAFLFWFLDNPIPNGPRLVAWNFPVDYLGHQWSGFPVGSGDLFDNLPQRFQLQRRNGHPSRLTVRGGKPGGGAGGGGGRGGPPCPPGG